MVGVLHPPGEEKAGHEESGEQRRDDTDDQRDGKPLDRP